MSPSDFTIIKNKIETSNILTEAEKKEWLFLLPRMSAEQMKELDRILSIRMPSASGGGGQRSEVGGQIAEARKEIAPQPAVKPVDLRPPTTPPASRLESLKSLTVQDLQEAPSIYDFLEKLTLKIEELLQAHAASGAQILAALEQSPLYKAYVESGLMLMAGEDKAQLNHDELEAFTDFRANLRKILK